MSDNSIFVTAVAAGAGELSVGAYGRGAEEPPEGLWHRLLGFAA